MINEPNYDCAQGSPFDVCQTTPTGRRVAGVPLVVGFAFHGRRGNRRGGKRPGCQPSPVGREKKPPGRRAPGGGPAFLFRREETGRLVASGPAVTASFSRPAQWASGSHRHRARATSAGSTEQAAPAVACMSCASEVGSARRPGVELE